MTEIQFIHNATFEEVYLKALDGPGENCEAGKALLDEILAPMPESPVKFRKQSAPPGLDVYMSSLYEIPLLDRAQEQHLFRHMNCLLYLAEQARLRSVMASGKRVDQFLELAQSLLAQAVGIRSIIIQRNLRLVVSIAKKHVHPGDNIMEVISDGNMSLIRAVEKFNYALGNKFSTYASWAIMKNFARSIPHELTNRQRFVSGAEGFFENIVDSRSQETDDTNRREAASRELRATMKDALDDREFVIIVHRFGMFGFPEMTLEELGRKLEITKERVRQLESRAKDKLLKRVPDEEALD